MKKGGGSKGNVKVVARVRPQNELETKRGGKVCVRLLGDAEIHVVEDDNVLKYTFDRVFGPESSQRETFEYVAKPVVVDVLEGYNATIFAYGQTSSGKTYTMEGPSIVDPDLRGIIPRTVGALFQGVAEADANIEFTVKVSFIEIYMERIRDLLDQFRTKTNLSVREDPRLGIYVAGVTEEYVTCESELLEVMRVGTTNRATAATGMNEGSSRSHSVFMVTVQQRNLDSNSTKSGKLFLVDLAGSEMVRKTHATGQQLEEAKTINKSLSALGLVINALTEKKDASGHVPYRDSKLTRVLQDSLGGNAKTALLINCSPSSYNSNETISTLRFGSRAKNIQNKPKINEQRSVEELSALLQKAENAIDMQQSYILALEGQLRAAGGGVNSAATHVSSMSSGAQKMVEDGAGGHAAVSGGGDLLALQERVTNLLAELKEEKEESIRVSSEVEKLTSLLKDKERLLSEASELMVEAERHCEEHRTTNEALEIDKSKALDDLTSVKEQLREATMKHEFEGQELRAHLEKLEGANAKLTAELDKETNMGGGSGSSASGVALGSGTRSTPTLPALAMVPPASRETAAMLVEKLRLSKSAIDDLAQRLGLSVDGAAYLRSREDAWTACVMEAAAFPSASKFESDAEESKQLAEVDAQRRQLAADLQLAAEKNIELEMQIGQLLNDRNSSSASKSSMEADKVFSARERNHMR
jgi:kinesin family protein 5